ncbi:MAG TPA: anaerobic sulfatase maturase [Armatimonadota bacterium]|nr:anaerobic sulfatase maturase [Armatimonadota bacterium]
MASNPAISQFNSVLVKPAGPDCNLDCDYCFYRPKAELYPDVERPRMTTSTLETFIRQYMQMAGPNPSFGWQGGEPGLMGVDFYRTVVDMQKRYGRTGQVVGNGFQTNATFIDNEWARFFAAYKFLIGVSLDGPQDLHDLHRPTLGGGPTYERVMKSIEVLKYNGVEFNNLCMVTKESVTQPERLYKFFRDHDMKYLQFIPLVEPGAEPGSLNPMSIIPEEYGEFLCRMFDQWSREWPPECYIRMFDDFLTVYAGHPMPSCVFQNECGRYFVVEHNGDIYACDFMVTPEWWMGNLTVTPLAEILSSAQYQTFARRKDSHKPQCQACQWLDLCHGGCQKHRLITSDSVASPTYFCESYKQFFAHSRRRFRRMADEITGRSKRQQAVTSATPKRKAKADAPDDGPGRNDPCACGSGRKFKHCCLGKDG